MTARILPSRQDGCFYALALAMMAAFYLWLDALPPHQPAFLLAPVSALAGAFCGVDFTLVAGEGYMGAAMGHAVAVDKSCSGGTFCIILFSLLVFTQLRRFPSLRLKAAAFAAMLLFSFASAIAATTLRVAVSIQLLGFDGVSPVLIHSAAGILTYLSATCTLYFAAHCGVTKFLSKRGCNHATVQPAA